jgi:regulatory protein
VALDLLARREHGSDELREKLLEREFDAVEIDEALTRLIAEGLLSQQRFVESFVSSHVRRGHGPVWIRAALERKKVSATEVHEALAAYSADWAGLAAEVRRKRFGAQLPADPAARARQSRFLQYRGFTAEQVRHALKGTGP